ncbi:MAG: pyruvate dehydrogenase complex dihydrolipoamide acetyltransferase [Alphaproteobacteria bacterium]|nr:pyruvate dehydrogenase complex dihydrolipoamide acetyltransferase [Alphaproteobacteria bacterium]
MATNILMPALSPTMEEGKLAKWLVKEGDVVKSGDILAEIETDKATMEFEAIDEGVIGKILVPEGTEAVKVNDPIAVLLGDDESAKDISAAMASIKDAVSKETVTKEAAKPAAPKAPEVKAPEAKAEAPKAEALKPASAPAAAAPEAKGERVFASPLAKRMAANAGIDIAAVQGSGPRGRIVKADVEAAEKSGVTKAAPAPAKTAPQAVPAAAGAQIAGIAPLPDARLFYKDGTFEEIPHDSMRKAIARRLTSAKTLIPHFYLTIDCRIDELMAMRAKLNAASPKENGFKLSVNDFVVKASALALMRVPEVNASWTDNAMLRHKHADIGVAVALDFGLITPIVMAAEGKGLSTISNEVKSLAERARAKKLKPEEFEGGSFAITNLGMFGIKQFTGVINPPHAAILAVGMGEQRPIVEKGALAIATMMTVTLSCDHRVIDGATGARFLQVFKQFIEEPASMLL